jgi:predicted transglutaminase-like cysteine proteinase
VAVSRFCGRFEWCGNGVVMYGTRGFLSVAAIISVFAVSFTGPVAAQAAEATRSVPRQLIDPPPGFRETCKRYSWFCENTNADQSPAAAVVSLDVAEKINRQVNYSVSELSDPENYGVADYWTLPTNGNGDCEDFVLQKYKLLIDAGVDSRNLSIAIVLDQSGDNHAVLILRHTSGDLVLDSLSRRIRLWNDTGYTYLAMQSGANKTEWEVVMYQPRDQNVLAQR